MYAFCEEYHALCTVIPMKVLYINTHIYTHGYTHTYTYMYMKLIKEKVFVGGLQALLLAVKQSDLQRGKKKISVHLNLVSQAGSNFWNLTFRHI